MTRHIRSTGGRIVAGLALAAGTVFAAGAAPASAATAPDCLEADTVHLGSSWSRSDPGAFSVTLQGPAGDVLCDDLILHISWYALPDTWNGDLHFNDTAVPQSLIEHGPDVVFAAGSATGTVKTVTELDVPECEDYQIDLYSGPVQTTVDASGHAGFIAGGLVAVDADAEECRPGTPTSSSSTTSEPSGTTESTQSEPATTTSATGTTTTESATTASTTASTTGTSATTVTSASTTTSAVAGVATTAPVQAAAALPFTGSNATLPLALGAAVLLGVGTVLTVVTRRRRPGHGA